MTDIISGVIEERGNGLPSVDDYAYDSLTNTVYRIVDIGRIFTGRVGQGNLMHVKLEEYYGDPTDLTEEQFVDIVWALHLDDEIQE